MGFYSRFFIIPLMVLLCGFHPFIAEKNSLKKGKFSNERVFKDYSTDQHLKKRGLWKKLLQRQKKKEDNRVVRKIQTYQGIKVFGSRIIEVFKGGCSDCKLAIMGRKADLYSMSTLPWIPLEKALQIARGLKKKKTFSKGRLVIYPTENENHLAWLIEEEPNGWERFRVFVDARNGHIIRSYNNVAYASKSFNSIMVKTNYFTPVVKFKPPQSKEINVTAFGVLDNEQLFHVLFNGDIFEMRSLEPNISTYKYKWRVRMPGQKITSVSENFHSVSPSAIDAHSYAQKFLSFLSTRFKRHSFDNKGGEIIMTVDYTDALGKPFFNSFWNGTQIGFGVGQTGSLLPMAGAFDIVVHEITHAIIEKSSALQYYGESGALNEAFCDIMASYAEYKLTPKKFDWKIGEDVWTPHSSGDALRYMNNPTQDGHSKDHYRYRYDTSNHLVDHGGVHWNSGIVNLAFHLLVEGGAHPRLGGDQVSGIGWEKAIDIFYKAFTAYLAPTAKFMDARDATVFAARELFDNQVAFSVMKAWEAVGVGKALPPGTDHEHESGGSNKIVSEVDLPIPDNDKSGVEDIITIKQRVRSLSISVDIEHPYRGDLTVRLISPQGHTYMLHRRKGKDQKNLKETYKRTLYNGENSVGDWTLKVTDFYRGDEGIFHKWSLSW